ANEAEPGVIYRRSNHSITFRCNHCSLQWTVTLANLHRAAKRKAAHLENSDPNNRITAVIAAASAIVARGTAFAAEHEAARRTSIKRQTKRRVIRLPDPTHA